MLHRLRRKSPRPCTAGGCMPELAGRTQVILAALIVSTSLAAFQLSSVHKDLAELPVFVVDALGEPREEDSAGTGWRTFENGVSRRTAWGHESIAYRGARPEKYLTVSERQGVRVWRWRLAAQEAGAAAPVVRILDAAGHSLSQANLRWSVRRDGSRWLVRLRVADANLPLPYVLEPMTVAQRGIR